MPEEAKTLDTVHGPITLEKNPRSGHMDKFLDVKGTPVKVTHDAILNMFHDPATENWKEGQGQGDKATAEDLGGTALEAATENQEKETFPFITRHATLGEIEITGRSDKYPNGADEKGRIYYKGKMPGQNGTRYEKLAATKLDLNGKKAERNLTDDASRLASREADEAVSRLDEILPPSDKEIEANREKTIEERFAELERKTEQRLKEILERFEKGDINNKPLDKKPEDEAETQVREDKVGKKPHSREVGNKIGDPGELEIRGQNKKGEPFIYRRDKEGNLKVSRNGNLAKEWFDATPEQMKDDIGIDLMSALSGRQDQQPDIRFYRSQDQPREVNYYGGLGPRRRGSENQPSGNGNYEGGSPTVEAEDTTKAFEDSQKKMKSLFEELYKTDDPQKREEIMKEIEKEFNKQQELWKKMPEDVENDTSAETEKETKEEKTEKKGLFSRQKDRIKSFAKNPITSSKTAYMNFVTEKDPKKRRKFILGFIAGGLAMLLMNKYGVFPGGGGHNPNNNVPDGTLFPGEHGGPMRGAHGVEHEVFFNSAEGHRRTAMMLPENLHPGLDAHGHQIIRDSQGNVVVSHLEAPSIAKESGVLSPRAAEVLRAKGYNVGYMHLQNVAGTDSQLYESVVS